MFNGSFEKSCMKLYLMLIFAEFTVGCRQETITIANQSVKSHKLLLKYMTKEVWYDFGSTKVAAWWILWAELILTVTCVLKVNEVLWHFIPVSGKLILTSYSSRQIYWHIFMQQPFCSWFLGVFKLKLNSGMDCDVIFMHKTRIEWKMQYDIINLNDPTKNQFKIKKLVCILDCCFRTFIIQPFFLVSISLV